MTSWSLPSKLSAINYLLIIRSHVVWVNYSIVKQRPTNATEHSPSWEANGLTARQEIPLILIKNHEG